MCVCVCLCGWTTKMPYWYAPRAEIITRVCLRVRNEVLHLYQATDNTNFVGFVVFRAVTMKKAIFCDVVPCGFIIIYIKPARCHILEDAILQYRCCPLQAVVAYPSGTREEIQHFPGTTFDNALLCNHIHSLNSSALLVRQLTQYIQAGWSLLNPHILCNSSVCTSPTACAHLSAGAGTAYSASSPAMSGSKQAERKAAIGSAEDYRTVCWAWVSRSGERMAFWDMGPRR
jgi:hypothetical protein